MEREASCDVTTELQVFGLVVTAEPYYAVTQPSDLIVMQNVRAPGHEGADSRRSTPSTNCCSAASISVWRTRWR